MHEFLANGHDHRILVKMLIAVGGTLLPNVCAWLFITTVAPLAWIYMLIIVPLTPILVMLCLGFFEHRLRSLLIVSAVCAMTGLLIAMLCLGPFVLAQIEYYAPMYLVGTWFSGMVGVGARVAVSRIVGTHRKIPDNACKHCGYNLTGNVSGVCPECGTPTGADAMPNAQGKEDSPS